MAVQPRTQSGNVIKKPAAVIEDGGTADAELVQLACARGSVQARQEAFAVLVTRYEGFVRAMLTRLCGQRDQADDLAQDTFLNAWLKLDTLQTPAAFRGWLRQLAYRQFLHGYRRAQVERKHAEAMAVEAVERELTSPESEDLEPLLSLCTPLERELMVLCYGFEFTYAEIASARGMAVGTVKSHVHRAKQKMQKFLELERSKATGNNHG